MRSRSLLAALWLLLLAGTAAPQTTRVEAVVVDARTGAPLEGVNVVVVGTGFGTVSDAAGRFVLLGAFSGQDSVEISHIGYVPRRVSIDSLRVLSRIELVPRAIEAREVTVEAEREMLISRDLPAAITVLPMATAASRGVDLADMLRRDPSLAISETASGAKFVSIRGGNPDEVLIVYDGIRLNSSAANTFDLSQVALSNLARVEIIKGSNTVLFGDGAFGGVLHIVPKKQFDRLISVSQRFGTFRANDLSLNLNKRVGRFAGSYTLSRRQAERNPRDLGSLTNDNLFQTVWLDYSTTRLEASGRYIRISNDFDSQAAGSNTETISDIFSGTLEGQVPLFGNLGLTLIRRQSDEQTTTEVGPGALNVRRFDDNATTLRAFKRDVLGEVRLYFSYERAWYGLDGTTENVRPAPLLVSRSLAELRRQQEAFIFIIQNHLDLERKSFRFIDWDLSARIDWMSDQRRLQEEAGGATAVLQRQTPGDYFLTYKFAFNATGEIRGTRYRAFITNGANVKFPTLQQQFFLDTQPLYAYRGGILDPERNIGTEFGVHLEREFPTLPGLFRIREARFDLALFRNSYLNKIAELLTPLVGSTTPFNTRLATTTGTEVQLGVALWNRLVDLSVGYLGLNISDPRVFQFKPEKKATFNLSVQHKGFSFWGNIFYEGRQTALLLVQGRVIPAELPSRWDVDLAVRQSYRWRSVKGFVAISLNNLRNSGASDPTGLFLRDRRWYVTFGGEL